MYFCTQQLREEGDKIWPEELCNVEPFLELGTTGKEHRF